MNLPYLRNLIQDFGASSDFAPDSFRQLSNPINQKIPENRKDNQGFRCCWFGEAGDKAQDSNISDNQPRGTFADKVRLVYVSESHPTDNLSLCHVTDIRPASS